MNVTIHEPNRYQNGTRSAFDRHEAKHRQSTEEIAPRSHLHNFDSPTRLMNTKLGFFKPGKGSQPLGDPEEDMDENGDCVARPSAFKRNSFKKKSNRALSGENWRSRLEHPEVFLDALDYAYDPTIPADKRFKDVILLEDVRYDATYLDIKPEEFPTYLKNFKFIEDKADTRVPWAHPKGGVACKEYVMTKYRNIAKGVMQEFGKKILSGNFNLTTVSFPIKSMVPLSFLEKCSQSTGLYPIYLNLALLTKDPLERFKLAITAPVAIQGYLEGFSKPLNPILGETFEAGFSDGTELFLEQVSHHPPISYILLYGPQKKFQMSGAFVTEATGGLNSLKDMLDGTLIGRCVHSCYGTFIAKDEKNGFECKVTFGKVKNKLIDYFEGEITHNGKQVSKITGTYLGWMEIDGKRYWDHRFIHPCKLNRHKSLLGSDSYYRPDLLTLALGEVEKAQKEKESLEQLQRYDRKLRKEYMEKQGKKATH